MSPTGHAWQLADRDRQGMAREVETLRKPALRVLIVEESEEDARLLLGELRRAYRPAYKRVETEPALISALEKQTWDIVLSDFSLPCFNGMAALKAVRAAGLDLPFLLISEAIGEELAVEVLRAGAQDFILKNRLSRLLPAIEREMHEARLRQERRQAQEQIRRTLTDIRADWKQVFETLAGQAGIAIDNALLLGALQRSNAELIMAYDLILEGWIRAIDLRDKETEGHSQRVMEMTLRLARRLGVGAAEMAHIRRGALLHDIGKLGIPDSILLKPGPLTEAEWEIMRQHPRYAYEWLQPIAYLRPALDIPYCHHEQWDGSGYPRGLQAEAIPVAARIFSIVDVWDALRSDRPYRRAWPEELARAHIHALSGKQFDPVVVDAFESMLAEGQADGGVYLLERYADGTRLLPIISLS